MDHVMRKPVFGDMQLGMTQNGLLSYSLEILDLASIGIVLYRKRTTKDLIRLIGWTG